MFLCSNGKAAHCIDLAKVARRVHSFKQRNGPCHWPGQKCSLADVPDASSMFQKLQVLPARAWAHCIYCACRIHGVVVHRYRPTVLPEITKLRIKSVQLYMIVQAGANKLKHFINQCGQC